MLAIVLSAATTPSVASVTVGKVTPWDDVKCCVAM